MKTSYLFTLENLALVEVKKFSFDPAFQNPEEVGPGVMAAKHREKLTKKLGQRVISWALMGGQEWEPKL